MDTLLPNRGGVLGIPDFNKIIDKHEVLPCKSKQLDELNLRLTARKNDLKEIEMKISALQTRVDESQAELSEIEAEEARTGIVNNQYLTKKNTLDGLKHEADVLQRHYNVVGNGIKSLTNDIKAETDRLHGLNRKAFLARLKSEIQVYEESLQAMNEKLKSLIITHKTINSNYPKHVADGLQKLERTYYFDVLELPRYILSLKQIIGKELD